MVSQNSHIGIVKWEGKLNEMALGRCVVCWVEGAGESCGTYDFGWTGVLCHVNETLMIVVTSWTKEA